MTLSLKYNRNLNDGSARVISNREHIEHGTTDSVRRQFRFGLRMNTRQRRSSKATCSAHARKRGGAMTIRIRSFASALVALTLAASAAEPDIKLPNTLTMTAYDTGSSGFNIAVAVGKAFKDKHNTDVRVLPAGNEGPRLPPVKGGRAQNSAM